LFEGLMLDIVSFCSFCERVVYALTTLFAAQQFIDTGF
jgi:hypothetical protein